MHRHFRIYKPGGFLSQFISNQRLRKNKRLLGELYDFPEGPMAVGRLDEASEGLLLLTTNGKLSTLVTRGKVEKEYLVQVDGLFDQYGAEQLRQGVTISIGGKPYLTRPCKLRILDLPPGLPESARPVRDERHGPTSWISIILTEGKFRQVRKMTAAVGFPTLRLVRIRIGNEILGDQRPGEVQEVSRFDL